VGGVGQVVMWIRAPFSLLLGSSEEFCAMTEGPSVVFHNEMSV
jgi:hypothetical protein